MNKLPEVLWRNNRVPRIVLGTAQLGMHYGIANTQGQPTVQQAQELIDAVWQHGITFFDTAQAYGDSEAILGQSLRQAGRAEDAHIVSKLSPDLDPASGCLIEHAIDGSCERLGIHCLWGLLLHRPAWLNRWDEGLGDILCAMRDRGRITYLGVSVYSVEEALSALEHPAIDILQVPCNVWDQRMKTAGIFERAHRLKKLCFIRSIYLQGLLTLAPEEVAARLPGAHRAARRWHELVLEYDTSPARLAMRFAKALDVPLVIGAETVQQINDTISLLNEPPLEREIIEIINCEMSPWINESILNPSQWSSEA